MRQSDRPTRLVFVRHGHAEVAQNKIVGGHLGCTGLTDLGRRQATALRDRLVGVPMSVDGIVTSVLPRAIETAEILASGFGVDVGSIPRWCGLCERHPGEGDGLSWDVFVERYGAIDPFDDPERPLSPGGESYRDLVSRVSTVVEQLAEEHRGKTVLVVSHGGVIQAATLTLLGLPPRWLAPDLANTGLTEWVMNRDGIWLLGRFNDAAHLESRRLYARLPKP
jgi:probable phosphoglycerate mutase